MRTYVTLCLLLALFMLACGKAPSQPEPNDYQRSQFPKRPTTHEEILPALDATATTAVASEPLRVAAAITASQFEEEACEQPTASGPCAEGAVEHLSRQQLKEQLERERLQQLLSNADDVRKLRPTCEFIKADVVTAYVDRDLTVRSEYTCADCDAEMSYTSGTIVFVVERTASYAAAWVPAPDAFGWWELNYFNAHDLTNKVQDTELYAEQFSPLSDDRTSDLALESTIPDLCPHIIVEASRAAAHVVIQR